jgi:hypothetical protein
LDIAREEEATASRRERRSSGRQAGVRRSGVVFAVVLGLLGLTLCIFGGLKYRDASAIDGDAADVRSERQELEAQEQRVRDRSLAIQSAANDVNTAIRRIVATSNDFIAAGRVVTDASNNAVAILNSGNAAGARSAFTSTVGPAVADQEAKLPPVNDAATGLQAAIDALRTKLDE